MIFSIVIFLYLWEVNVFDSVDSDGYCFAIFEHIFLINNIAMQKNVKLF